MEWLDEEREERSNQIDRLEGHIGKVVQGLDQRFVDFTEKTKDKFNDVREDWDNDIDAMEDKIKNNSLKMTRMTQGIV
eukprot:CAMPEP_0205825306 /NCGR_PEP_ID=MMETSP0206-20130828/24705_1 /ASSEMBLY_ACC=CAM_ASM_000279 /TAXON_ID=36767 /ORGANISM="Euplotes focardii, Strain TN1" /LENGTH=77 /DNA_ID=CAMNT_0053124247 /DNA_START=264 /DNA_END=497 /DNA_ORIENTATION=+